MFLFGQVPRERSLRKNVYRVDDRTTSAQSSTEPMSRFATKTRASGLELLQNLRQRHSNLLQFHAILPRNALTTRTRVANLRHAKRAT